MENDESLVKMAHENHVDKLAHRGHSLAQWIAIFSALLASIGATISYNVSTRLNETTIMKNEALMTKEAAADQWNYYQAESLKAHLADLAVDIAPHSLQAKYRDAKDKHTTKKERILKEAESLDASSAKQNSESNLLAKPVHHLELAQSLIQIAIALASITALTRRVWLLGFSGIAATVGVILAITSIL